MNYFIGLDIGTSSIRAVMFDENGYQKCFYSEECTVRTSFDGTAEIDPEAGFSSVLKVIKGCMEISEINYKQLSGIGISCHMHSLMLIDKEMKPITALLTWADTRAINESRFIEENYDVSTLYNRTGCRVQHPMYPLSKILWLKNNFKDIYNKAYKFITFKEYIIFRLFGKFLIDYTLAASQGFYDIHKQCWDKDIILNILGIDESRLSEVAECTHVLKGMAKDYAEYMGIDENVSVVIGSGDGIMANIGCGVCDDTSLSSTIGTSGAIRTAVSKPLLDPKQQTWCYSFTKDMWVAGGAINNGGIVLKWLREEFGKLFESEARENNISIYALMDRLAYEIAPGSDGLIFLPYLTGERSPDWNAGVRGLMYGLSISHGRKHIVRAAMEGIMYRMFSVYEVLSSMQSSAVQIRANGGYVKSDLWLKIQADIFNKPILVSGTGEASALGAAYTAMLGVGAVRDIKQLLPGMKPQRIINPDEENHIVYEKVYRQAIQVYKSMYK